MKGVDIGKGCTNWLHKPVFSNCLPHVSLNHAQEKEPFKWQDGLMDFDVTNKKFTDGVPDPSVQLTCKKLLLVEF